MNFWPFNRQPHGYTLIRAGGRRHNRIRGDLIPAGTKVITQDDRHFVRTGKRDESGFLVYEEGHSTFEYRSAS